LDASRGGAHRGDRSARRLAAGARGRRSIRVGLAAYPDRGTARRQLGWLIGTTPPTTASFPYLRLSRRRALFPQSGSAGGWAPGAGPIGAKLAAPDRA